MAQTVFFGGEGMDKVPLCWNGTAVGEVTMEKEGLYTCFSVRGRLPKDSLWSAWIVGEAGELRLGVLEPCGEYAEIRRQYSERLIKPLGAVHRGEIRKVQPESSMVKRKEHLPFQTLWLREMLQRMEQYQLRQQEDHYYLAIPFKVNKPFPLPPLFCLARIIRIAGEECAVFCFDETEWPVIPSEWDGCVFSSPEM